ncbi:MAG: DUF3237 domain-containing protein [Croceibacterium sp.]
MFRVTASAALAVIAITPLAASAQQAPTLEFAFEEIVTLGTPVAPGDTPRGGRLIIPITGGTFEGPDIKGTVMPGGWDWQLRRTDGCTEVEADYFIKTDDGVVINVLNTGTICTDENGKPMAVRTHPVLEAPVGKYEWLNKTTFVGTLDGAPASAGPAVRIRLYRVR